MLMVINLSTVLAGASGAEGLYYPSAPANVHLFLTIGSISTYVIA
jgi:hypothetical protein